MNWQRGLFHLWVGLVHRLGRLLRLEGASLDGPRRRKLSHNRHLHHRPAIAVPRVLGDSLDCLGVPGMTITRPSGKRSYYSE
jgi:hypothetical protein